MILFLIKKWFFDCWDNLLWLLVGNLLILIAAAVPIIIPPRLATVAPEPALLVFVLGFLFVMVLVGTLSFFIRDITDYQSIEVENLREYIAASWKQSIAFGLLNLFLMFLVVVGFPVYSGMDNLVGTFAMVVLFWGSLTWLLTSQYYFPVRARVAGRFKLIIRKSLAMFFDNTAFSVFLGFGSLLIMLVSVFTAFLMPGFIGMLVWVHVASKLRLKKYDY
ncbi:MAG: hypothetical protein LC641_07345, partial [Spirochaeta sp.]|nr:hypothetical protein [Spirochaeta sp.]